MVATVSVQRGAGNPLTTREKKELLKIQAQQLKNEGKITEEEKKQIIKKESKAISIRARNKDKFRKQLEKELKRSVTPKEAEELRTRLEGLSNERGQSVPLSELRKQVEAERKASQTLPDIQKKPTKSKLNVVLGSAFQAPEVIKQIKEQGGKVTRAETVGTDISGQRQTLIEFESNKKPTLTRSKSAQEIQARQQAELQFELARQETGRKKPDFELIKAPNFRKQKEPNQREDLFQFGVRSAVRQGGGKFSVGVIEDILGLTKNRSKEISIQSRTEDILKGKEGITLTDVALSPFGLLGGGFATRKGAQLGVSLLSKTPKGARFLTGITSAFVGTKASRVATQTGLGTVFLAPIAQQTAEEVNVQTTRAGKIEAIGSTAIDLTAFGTGFGLARKQATETFLLRSGRLELKQLRSKIIPKESKPSSISKIERVNPFQRVIQRSELETLQRSPLLSKQKTGLGTIERRGIIEGNEARFVDILKAKAGTVKARDLPELIETRGTETGINAVTSEKVGISSTGIRNILARFESEVPQLKPKVKDTGSKIRGIRPSKKGSTPLKLKELEDVFKRPTTRKRITKKSKTKKPKGLERPDITPSQFASISALLKPQSFKGLKIGFDETPSITGRFAQRPTTRSRLATSTKSTQSERTLNALKVSQVQRQEFKPLQIQRQTPKIKEGILPKIRLTPSLKLSSKSRTKETPIFETAQQLKPKRATKQNQRLKTQKRQRPRPPLVKIPTVRNRGDFKFRFDAGFKAPKRKGKKKGKFDRIFFSDLLSVNISDVTFGSATSPRNTPKVIKEARRTAFTRIPTIELRRRK